MKHVYILPVLLLLLFSFSCSIQNGLYHKPQGSYEIKITKTASDTNPLIKANLYEQGTKNSLIGGIRINNKEVVRPVKNYVSAYTFNVFEGTYFYQARSVGFKSVNTKRFKVHRGDTVSIDFYLQYDTTPM